MRKVGERARRLFPAIIFGRQPGLAYLSVS
jgi:hypothetical protein